MFNKARKQLFRRVYGVPLLYGAFGCIIFGVSSATFILKTSMPLTVSHTKTDVSVDSPVELKLNQKLSSIDISKISLTPEEKGEWRYHKGNVLAGDSIIFTPTTALKTGTTYTVRIAGIQRLIVGDTNVNTVRFTTESAPDIRTDIGLGSVKSGSTIPADKPITVTLAKTNDGLRDIELRTEPTLILKRSTSDNTTYSWKSSSLLPQGKAIKILLYDRKNEEALLTTSVKIASEPTVEKFVKSSYFTDTDTAVITFSSEIDTSSSPNITFNLDGEGKWINSRTYQFKPKSVSAGKTYSYVVPKGIRTVKGGILTKAISRSFQTTGNVGIAASSPHGANRTQASQNVSFTFDQAVDKASAERNFRISSGKIKSMRWSGNTLTVVVTNLGYQRTVTASLLPGVKNASFGLPSIATLTHSFTTEYRTKRLNIPFYAQQHRATCAVASLRMALAYYGINAGEMDIVNRMGYAPKKMNKSTNPPTWDDPALMFVGSVDGSIKDGTGAGPDAPPVAKAAQSYGRSASSVRGISTSWIAQQLYNGDPVIMFGAYSNTGTVRWKTPSGRITTMNITSHATLVTGVAGEPGSPIGFWVSDPLTGGNQYWSASAVEADISRDPYRQAVVIR